MINSKICSKCKIEKLVSEFGTASPNKDGYNSWCKQCVRDSSKKYRDTPAGIYSALKGRCKFYETHAAMNRNIKPFIMELQDFVVWYNAQEKKCGYCDILEKHLYLVEKSHGRYSTRLEIDCKDNDMGYTIDNIVLACRKCNFIKLDYFSYDEMRRLAQMFIKPKWQKIVNMPSVTEMKK